MRIDQFLTMNTHIHRFLLLLVGQEEDTLSLATPIIEDLREDFALLYDDKQGFFQLASEYVTLTTIKSKAELFEDAKRNIIPLIRQLRTQIKESISIEDVQQLQINEPPRSSTVFKKNNLYKFLEEERESLHGRGKRSHHRRKPKRRSNTKHSQKHRLQRVAHQTPTNRRKTRRRRTYLGGGRRRKSIRF